jgi:tRNA (cmo5U34)-methyltransferase
MRDVPAFQFDSKVAEVFPDMIQRSVPGYSTILHMISQIAARYVQANTQVYDLGCSLGASLLAARQGVRCPGVKIVGVDNSAAMLERCRERIDADQAPTEVELLQSDILDVDFSNTSLCILNFTLQFVPVERRADLLRKIHDAMVPGGVLVLSEKLDFSDTQHNELMIDLHHDFKRANGYSQLEIAQKRDAIENVLLPETYEIHRNRLIEAGFNSADLWFQCFNFSSLIAFA